MRMSEWKAARLGLAVFLLLCGCSSRPSDVNREALEGVDDALRIARETPGIVQVDADAQAAWSSALAMLDDARSALLACEGNSDECLATGLSHLLEADQPPSTVEQMNAVAVTCRFGEIQSRTRQAAILLYVYFYGDAVSPESSDWRGPPTPRPPGVCPGG